MNKIPLTDKQKDIKIANLVKATTLQQLSLSNRNATIHELEETVNNYSDMIIKQKHLLDEANSRIEKLRNMVDRGSKCPCDDWESAGSDPMTGDKFKRCNMCGEVSVR